MTITGNGGPGEQPQLNVLAQYTKDFSFENPNAPKSLTPGQQQPSINIQINVNATPLAETEVEVELKLDGKAESDGQLLFAFELVYAGVFRIQNIPQENVHPIVMALPAENGRHPAAAAAGFRLSRPTDSCRRPARKTDALMKRDRSAARRAASDQFHIHGVQPAAALSSAPEPT